MMNKLKELFSPKDEQRFKDYSAAFSTPEGKRVLEDLMREFHALQPTFVPGDPSTSAFRDGGRNVILYILTQMRWAEGDYQRYVQDLPILEDNDDDEPFDTFS